MAVHERSVTVKVPVHQVFGMWKNFEDFPKIMRHVEEVKMLDPTTSHWKGRVAGIEEEWDAKTTKMEEGKVIAWQSTSGFRNSGEVRFDSVPEGTKITVHFEYEPPGGVLGDIGEAIYVGREFENDLQEDLDKFKNRVECKAG